MNRSKLLEILEKRKRSIATDEEIQELESFYLNFEKQQNYTDKLDERENEIYKEIIYSQISSRLRFSTQDKEN